MELMKLSNLESDIAESEVKKSSFKVVFVEKIESTFSITDGKSTVSLEIEEDKMVKKIELEKTYNLFNAKKVETIYY